MPAKSRQFLVLACLLIPVLGESKHRCHADTPFQIRYADPLRQPWRISRFRELEGYGVRCATEDSQGNMWFGLRDGVVKYDGYDWDFGTDDDCLSGQTVEALTRTQDDSLIAATANGLFQFDGVNWARIAELPAIPLGEVSFVKESSDGSLWTGCEWGLIRVKDGTASG